MLRQHTHCDQLVSIILLQFVDMVNGHTRPLHTNTHCFRKGSAVHATSGTTCPPPLSSVANRGEWLLLGKIFDLYFSFAEPGDCFLGRILAGLNCNSADFATLPHHFKDESKSHPAVVEASLEFSFSVLQAWSITLNSLQPKWQRTHNTDLPGFHCYIVQIF